MEVKLAAEGFESGGGKRRRAAAAKRCGADKREKRRERESGLNLEILFYLNIYIIQMRRLKTRK